MAGRDGRRAGESLPGWRASVRARARKSGPKVEEVAAAGRREALPCASVSRRSGKQAAAVTKVRLSASRLPSKWGDQLEPQLARRRGNEIPWLFESMKSEFDVRRRNILGVIRGLDPPAGPKPPSARRRPAYPSLFARVFRRRWIAGSKPGNDEHFTPARDAIPALNTAASFSSVALSPPRSTTQDHPRTAETPAPAPCPPRRSARHSLKASARSGRR
jgi:hypothetical protein